MSITTKRLIALLFLGVSPTTAYADFIVGIDDGNGNIINTDITDGSDNQIDFNNLPDPIGTIRIGYDEEGQLLINNGSSLQADSVRIKNGTLNIQNTNSHLQINESLTVGTSDHYGTLNIKNGATLNTPRIVLQNSTMNISGTNTVLNITPLNNYPSSTINSEYFNLSDGAKINSKGHIELNYFGTKPTQIVNIQGQDTTWKHDGQIALTTPTFAPTTQFNLSDGAHLIIRKITVFGAHPDNTAHNILNISGSNTIFSAVDSAQEFPVIPTSLEDVPSLQLGDPRFSQSTTTLNLTQGATLNTAQTYIHKQSVAFIKDTNTLWNAYEIFTKGNLTVSNGATVNIKDQLTFDDKAFYNSNPISTLTITGQNTSLNLGIAQTITNIFENPEPASPTLTINPHAIFLQQSGNTIIADGATLNTPNLQIESGTFDIQNGATAITTNSYLGGATGSKGTVTVTGSGSTWTNTDDMAIGESGQATFNIKNGATLNSNALKLGGFSGRVALKEVANQATTQTAKAIINLQNLGSTITTKVFWIGDSNTAQLNITDQAQIIVQQSLFISDRFDTTLNLSLTNPTDNPFITIADDARINGKLNILTDNLQDLTYNDTFMLLDIGDDLTGVFDNLAENDIAAYFQGLALRLTYHGGDGNDIELFTTAAPALGDANDDGQIDQFDLDLVQQHFGTNNFLGDANHDGTVNLQDLFAVRNNYNSNATAIPEPTTLALLALPISLLLKRRTASN